MLVDQKISIHGNDITLKNTFDIGQAKSLVADINKSGLTPSADMRHTGEIPPELWECDPILMMARKSQQVGDQRGFAKYVQMFLNANSAFRIDNPRRIWQGVSL